MLRRQQVVQNEVVARTMREFFPSWPSPIPRTMDNQALAELARRYGSHVLNLWRSDISRQALNVEAKQTLSRSRFTIGLSTQAGESSDFELLTKRATLVSDTLLLSHDWTGPFHELGTRVWSGSNTPSQQEEIVHLFPGKVGRYAERLAKEERTRISNDSVKVCGMHCPNLSGLGRWILDAKPLLKAGLVWYLPSYSIETREAYNGRILERAKFAERLHAVDYLIRNGRAVDASGAEPVKSQLVRPVLQVDLPFIEGVNLRDFSKITVGEFASYAGFRDSLRLSFLDMDEAMNAVESDRELVKLGLQIKDQVRATRTELAKTQRKRAVTVTGAVIGSVGAILVAVYGPALAAAVATVGAGGGVWAIIHAATENSTRHLRENKWYYVWVLAKKNSTDVL